MSQWTSSTVCICRKYWAANLTNSPGANLKGTEHLRQTQILNPYIFATKYCNPLLFKDMNFPRSNSQSLEYQFGLQPPGFTKIEIYSLMQVFSSSP